MSAVRKLLHYTKQQCMKSRQSNVRTHGTRFTHATNNTDKKRKSAAANTPKKRADRTRAIHLHRAMCSRHVHALQTLTAIFPRWTSRTCLFSCSSRFTSVMRTFMFLRRRVPVAWCPRSSSSRSYGTEQGIKNEWRFCVPSKISASSCSCYTKTRARGEWSVHRFANALLA